MYIVKKTTSNVCSQLFSIAQYPHGNSCGWVHWHTHTSRLFLTLMMLLISLCLPILAIHEK